MANVTATDFRATDSPADHYNIHLLAESAQMQRRKEENNMEGPMTIAQQYPAKPDNALMKSNIVGNCSDSKFSNISSNFPYSHFVVAPGGQPVRTVFPANFPASSLAHQIHRSTLNSSTGWMLPENHHITPELNPSNSVSSSIPLSSFHNPNTGSGTPDFSFTAQDSPLLMFTDPNLSIPPKTNLPTVSTISHTETSSCKSGTNMKINEPELKSPLDHPDQRSGHFFSSSATSEIAAENRELDDEEPLNDKDKQLFTAIASAFEPNEKIRSSGELTHSLGNKKKTEKNNYIRTTSSFGHNLNHSATTSQDTVNVSTSCKTTSNDTTQNTLMESSEQITPPVLSNNGNMPVLFSSSSKLNSVKQEQSPISSIKSEERTGTFENAEHYSPGFARSEVQQYGNNLQQPFVTM